ncbi:MAG: preprotein translocase subunit SecG [Holosporales bacterium]|jgi:preprotein translocase subunit SecG|nr:preprotein translocase subunit SecG [Holosporales bacterium]
MGILLAVHVLVTVLLILIVLIQKTEGGSSLFASGGSGSMFSARGASNMLTKATWILAFIFLINCIVMAFIASHEIENSQTILKSKSNRPSSDKSGGPARQGKSK